MAVEMDRLLVHPSAYPYQRLHHHPQSYRHPAQVVVRFPNHLSQEVQQRQSEHLENSVDF